MRLIQLFQDWIGHLLVKQALHKMKLGFVLRQEGVIPWRPVVDDISALVLGRFTSLYLEDQIQSTISEFLRAKFGL